MTNTANIAANIDSHLPIWLVCLLVLSLALPLANDSARADADINNIAVIQTDATILQPGELFDLNNKTVVFTPKVSGGYTASVLPIQFDSNQGTNLNLFDDDFVGETLPFNFRFYGSNKNTLYINSNGNLTFDSPDPVTIHFNQIYGGGHAGARAIGQADQPLEFVHGARRQVAMARHGRGAQARLGRSQGGTHPPLAGPGARHAGRETVDEGRQSLVVRQGGRLDEQRQPGGLFAPNVGAPGRPVAGARVTHVLAVLRAARIRPMGGADEPDGAPHAGLGHLADGVADQRMPVAHAEVHRHIDATRDQTRTQSLDLTLGDRRQRRAGSRAGRRAD